MFLRNGGSMTLRCFHRHYSSSRSDQQKILPESVSLVNGGTEQRLLSYRGHCVEWVSHPQLVLSEREVIILSRFICIHHLPKWDC